MLDDQDAKHGNLSSGHTQSPVSSAHPHPAFKFQFASSQFPLSTGEPPEAVTPERHSASLRPGFPASLGNDGSENQDSALVQSETITFFEGQGKGKGSATVTAKPIQTATVQS